jgi:general secretion pathway protein E
MSGLLDHHASMVAPLHPPTGAQGAAADTLAVHTTDLIADIDLLQPSSGDPSPDHASSRPDHRNAPDSSSAPSSFPPPSREFLELIPHNFARRHLVLGSDRDDPTNTELLLVSERTRPSAVLNVARRLGRPVTTRPADAESIATAIDHAYARAAANDASSSQLVSDSPTQIIQAAADIESELAAAVRDAERDLLNLDNKAPTVKLVDLILFEALQRSASDVHIQPLCDRTLVRYRLDGALHTARELPGSLASSVVSRIKVMAKLDVAERRAPQDGRAGVSIGSFRTPGVSPGTPLRTSGANDPDHPSPPAPRRIDLRVSTLPSTYGERVVLRLLDPSRASHLLSFDGLGMPAAIRDRYLAQVARVSGIVLSTGPTGSGKTTTLYTTLAWISATNATIRGTGVPPVSSPSSSPPPLPNTPLPGRNCELNVMTIEDPVEYDLSSSAGLSISQTQVDPRKNVTFATGLRHILRQDPDAIMVGEIRDEETARMAVQASLTGHLVLSTLHTNDAPSAIIRLIDLGVEPFLVSSSLAAVLAQRLIRRTHPDCRAEGCEHCLHTGYKGRTGVFELLVVDPPIRDLIARRASAADLKSLAVSQGMTTLRQAGAHLVATGITTPAEVARAIESPEEADA